jgi:hypothetical protein
MGLVWRMPLMIVLVVGLLFYFGPGVPAVIGLIVIGVHLVLVAGASAVIFRVFGPPKNGPGR